MREDMARVIVERPRIKPFNTRKGRARSLEDLPQYEGMRRAPAMARWKPPHKEAKQSSRINTAV